MTRPKQFFNMWVGRLCPKKTRKTEYGTIHLHHPVNYVLKLRKSVVFVQSTPWAIKKEPTCFCL